MYIPKDLWNIIKSYMFHNIKTQGKHLKDDIYVKLYNYCLKQMCPLIIPNLGPRIIYDGSNKNYRFIKFIYLRPMKYDIFTNTYKNNFKIVVTQLLKENYDENPKLVSKLIDDEYYKKN